MIRGEILLRRLLEQAGGAEESGYVLVLEEGLEGLPDRLATGTETYAVHSVRTEIGLRHLLWKAQGAPIIAVLPEELAMRLQRAPDIVRRARRKRIHALSVNEILEVALGVRVVGAEDEFLERLALENVERIGQAMSGRTLPTVVDRAVLREILLDVLVGNEFRRRSAGELLATWVTDPPRWSEDLARVVVESLPSLLGDEGRLLAWALGEPEVRLPELVVRGAVLSIEAAEVPRDAWGPLWRAASDDLVRMDRQLLRQTLTRLAVSAIEVLGDGAARVLTEADRVARTALSPVDVATSRVLPLAFADRCHALAKDAAVARVIPAGEIAWLAAHRAAGLRRAELAVLEAMARLTRYVHDRRSPAGDVLDQVRAYLREGAFADLAAAHLRQALAACGSFHAEAGELLSIVGSLRDDDNRRFAEALATGYEASLHREGITPLHRVWKRTIAPVWQSDPRQRLFLVVLDGCSLAVFLDLLRSLAGDPSCPIGLGPSPEGLVSPLPALAPLPTVTSHSRGAIFLGELPEDPLVAETVFRGEDEPRTDKARFNQNASLGARSRRLFLKGDLGDGGRALLDAVGGDEMDVVAAVFNAVDDQIGSANTGAHVRLAPENIMGFKPALRTALGAGRRVLLTADHGHTPFVAKDRRIGAGKTPRYLSLGQGEEAPDGFLEIDLGGLGGPPERRAFAWRSGAYRGSPQVGFHGGCSLEEMVVPLAWLVAGGIFADEPGWWHGQGAIPEREGLPRPVERPLVTPTPSDPLQLVLPPPASTRPLELPEAFMSTLGRDETTVLVLLRDNGTARSTELSAHLHKDPGRLNGLMRQLRRKLHEGGLTFFTAEVLPSGETLYRYVGEERP